MVKFANVDKLSALQETTTYPMEQLGPKAKLIIKCAHGEQNPAIRRAQLRRAKATQNRGNQISEAAIASLREEDRKLFANHVVVSWEGITDTKGKPVEFSPDACYELFTQIPKWLFDQLRLFAADVSNFLPDDFEETAGN